MNQKNKSPWWKSALHKKSIQWFNVITFWFVACSSPGPNIAGSVFESSFIDFDPNSALYRTDTFIEGINLGTDLNTGVNLTIIRSTATPDSVNLNELFELIMLPVTGAAFGNRAFIRLKQAIDRDVSFTYNQSYDLKPKNWQAKWKFLEKNPNTTYSELESYI